MKISIKILLSIIIISYLQNILQAEKSELSFSPFWDFYSNNRLSTSASGKGYTGIAGRNDISGVVLNPASLEILKHKFQFCFEYVYKSNIQWLDGVVSDVYLKELQPAFLSGLGVNLNKYIQTGILYYTGNSYKLDLGEVRVIDENGNTIGETYCYKRFRINSLSMPIVTKYKNIRFGVNINYLYYCLESILIGEWYGEECSGKASFYKLVPKFGIIISPLKNLSLGATFLPETKATIEEKWSPKIRWIVLEPSIKGDWFTPEDTIFNNTFPLEVGVGLQYKLNKLPLSFYLDYNYYDYSKDELLVDRNDIHFGAEYEFNRYFILRAGFFRQQDYRDENIQWYDDIGDYEQIFVTSGASIRLESFGLNFSIMDSHIGYIGEKKQTYINGGMTYNF